MIDAAPGSRVLELPELVSERLDAAAVERFFADLAFETTVLAILLRPPDDEPADAALPTTSLRLARERVLAGAASGAQIRYVHGDVEWWDTLMRTKDGFRVVRVRGERK